jgi:hypothetical protein
MANNFMFADLSNKKFAFMCTIHICIPEVYNSKTLKGVAHMITNTERLKCPSNNSCKHILMCMSDTDSYKTERKVNEFKLEIFRLILFLLHICRVGDF